MFTLENIDAFLEGLAILGTGGGGSPEWGRAMLEQDLKMGRTYQIIAPEDVPDDAVAASGGIMGSLKKLEKIDLNELMDHWEQRFELAEAFSLQERLINKKIDLVVPFEMGGMNTPVILTLGARTKRPIIDGDGVGRAAPETQMASFIGHGISLTPMPLVDAVGNSIVVYKSRESTFSDLIGRWMITRGGGMGANCHYPMSGLDLKRCVIPKTISNAVALGERLQKARREKADPVHTVEEFLGGKYLLTGQIEKMEEKEWEGFYFTEVLLSNHVELIIKNETMALFIKGKPVTVFPDLILMLDPKTGSGLMSNDLRVGHEISIVVKGCHPRLREAMQSPVGKEAFSPACYGYPELEYKPVEDLLKDSRNS